MIKIAQAQQQHSQECASAHQQSSSPPFLQLGEALAEFENTLQQNKNVYDFRITREDAPSYPNESVLLFRIRYNDYESPTPDPVDIQYIHQTATDIAKLAKQVGYAAAVLQIQRLSNNKFITYKLLALIKS